MNRITKNLVFIVFISFAHLNVCFSQKESKHIEYYEFSNNMKDSIKRVYFLDENGKLTGEDTYFRIGSNIKEEINHWKNGELIDSIIRFNSSGDISSIGYISKDTLTFKDVETSRKLSKARLREGKRNGLEVIFDENGEIKHFIGYVDNIMVMLIALKDIKRLNALITYETTYKYSSKIRSHSNGTIDKINFTYNDSFGARFDISFYENGQLNDVQYRASKKYIGVNSLSDSVDNYAFDINGKLIEK